MREGHPLVDRREHPLAGLDPFISDAHAAAPCARRQDLARLVGLPDPLEDLVAFHRRCRLSGRGDEKPEDEAEEGGGHEDREEQEQLGRGAGSHRFDEFCPTNAATTRRDTAERDRDERYAVTHARRLEEVRLAAARRG